MGLAASRASASYARPVRGGNPLQLAIDLGKVVCHDYRCVFVHVPRTGGTSIAGLLDPARRYERGGQARVKHWPIDQYDLTAVPGYFRFAFVRNPWDMMVSLWRQLTDWHLVPAGIPFGQFVLNCELFVRRGLPDDWDRALLTLLRRGQTWWVKPELGLLDFVGRYEHLESDFAHIESRIGLEGYTLPRRNRTRHRPRADYYDLASREAVAARFARDIETFGYEF